MIISCKLQAYKSKNSKDVRWTEEMLVSKGRGIEINSQNEYDTNHFKFFISSTKPLEDIFINTNNTIDSKLHNVQRSTLYEERIQPDFLSSAEASSEIFHYESEKISARNFLKYNLGEYSFLLSFIDESGASQQRRLKNIRNLSTHLDTVNLLAMYQSVLDSDFFELFIDGLIGSTRVDLSDEEDESYGFWILRNLIRRYLQLIKPLISSSKIPLDNVTELTEIKSYSREKYLHGQDIEWLSQNPHALDESPFGDINLNRRSYKVNNIQQTRTDFNHLNYENKLILSCLQSMADFFEVSGHTSIGNNFFTSLDKLLAEKLNDDFFQLSNLLKIPPPYDEVPEFNHKMIEDEYYYDIYKIIVSWYQFQKYEIGSHFPAPIPVVWQIFEYYCISEIINAFKEIDFVISNQVCNNDGLLKMIQLQRVNSEILEIYYEPVISHKTEDKPVYSTNPSYGKEGSKIPDFLIHYKSENVETLGVLDAKYTNDSNIISLSKEIFEKYGLYFFKENGSPIDYVVSLYPKNSREGFFANYRQGKMANIAKPFLGMSTIPTENSIKTQFYKVLREFILGKLVPFQNSATEHLETNLKEIA